MPDRQVIYKGRHIFVELKKKGKKPRKLQVSFMRALMEAGSETLVIDDRKQVDKLINCLLKQLPVDEE